MNLTKFIPTKIAIHIIIINFAVLRNFYDDLAS